MKKIIFISLVFISFFSHYSCKRCTTLNGNQDSIAFNFQTFDTINVYDIFNVFVKQDTFFSIKIKGDKNLLKNVEVSKIDKNIEIIDKNTCYFLKLKHSKLDVYITAPSLDYIQLYSASSVYSIDTLHFTRFGIRTFGYYASSNICVDCKDHFFLGIWNSTGDFYVSGKAKYYQILNHGHAYIHSFDLKSQYTDIEQRSTGNIEVFSQKKLNVKIFESGDIIYQGNPEITAIIEGKGKLTRSK